MLPAGWEVRVSARGADARGADAAIEIVGGGGYATLAVEARSSVTPRDVERLFGSLGRTLRALNPAIGVLVVAPWLSPRTRELLEKEGANYLDLSGNILIKTEVPALFIRSQGALRDPSPTRRGEAGLRGPKAGRLIRTLVDIRPPYGVNELASATELTPGYVSKLLKTLHDESVVERGPRGRVVSVDIAGALRTWSETYDVFASNMTRTFIAPPGPSDILRDIGAGGERGRIAVTGSFAAVQVAPPIAAPALLALYVDDADALSKELRLLPADAGANVVLMAPFDEVIWKRTRRAGGLDYVAAAQVVVDCLTGNGRMPSEGQAVLEWMLTHESAWRQPSIGRQ